MNFNATDITDGFCQTAKSIIAQKQMIVSVSQLIERLISEILNKHTTANRRYPHGELGFKDTQSARWSLLRKKNGGAELNVICYVFGMSPYRYYRLAEAELPNDVVERIFADMPQFILDVGTVFTEIQPQILSCVRSDGVKSD